MEAFAFLHAQGVLLESGDGPVLSLANAVTGNPIRGSWWSHPRSREIFALTRLVRDSPEVLVCRVIGGKVTYVHSRLWPALVRVSQRFPPAQLARIREVHTASGRHALQEVPYPDWVPEKVTLQASELDESAALLQLGPWLAGKDPAAPKAHRGPQAK